MKINQGDVFWVAVDESNEIESDHTHPHVIIQDNRLANTVVICALTSNLKRAKALGNILLKKGEANLPKQSVIEVSKMFTIDKTKLGEYIGTLTEQRINQVLASMNFLQTMTQHNK